MTNRINAYCPVSGLEKTLDNLVRDGDDRSFAGEYDKGILPP